LTEEEIGIVEEGVGEAGVATWETALLGFQIISG